MLMGFFITAGRLSAQEILPSITVKNLNGRIIVSWKNEYPFEVKTINIQRSYDSTKNFSTIGSVLNPQNIENGFVDEAPPYNKMYYRVFISFDAGAYVFSESVRPVKAAPPPLPLITQPLVTIPVTPQPVVSQPTIKQGTDTDPFEKADELKESLKNNKNETDKKPETVKDKKGNPVKQPVAKNNRQNQKSVVQPKADEELPVIPKEEPITYPSRRIYTAKDNNIVINLPNFDSRRYVVKFFDEEEKPLFELNRIRENYLIIEKVNFLHAGWFYFEIFENGRMIEKNKFFIAKDGKNP